MPKQPSLFLHGFATAEQASPIYCHQEFLDKVQQNTRSPVARRASLLVERLAVDPRREYFKGTLGVNKGWRRSRLGGAGGSHFYAWWAPRGAPPLREGGFESAPEGAPGGLSSLLRSLTSFTTFPMRQNGWFNFAGRR